MVWRPDAPVPGVAESSVDGAVGSGSVVAGVVSSVGEETGVVLSGSVGSGSAVSGGGVSGKVGSGTVVPVPVELSGDSGEVSLLPGLVSV
jgi:hypothetical protein